MLSYKKTIDYLYLKLPMFSRVGEAAYKKDLTNTIAFCNHLNNPQNKFKTIHVAGTNGKGSVCHTLASMLQEAGYKVGLYTSPHLVDFRERIKINGHLIPQSYVQQFVEDNKTFINDLEPSFFEVTVGLAFSYFADKEVDIAIIETGLGGRLDSTNIIIPILSIITNIGLDHVSILGDTIAKIAAEKAGIIKQNVPIIIGENHLETIPVFNANAIKNSAPIFYAQKLHKAYISDKVVGSLTIEIDDKVNVETPLSGLYQKKNLITVYQAFTHLQKDFDKLRLTHFKKGVKNVIKNTGLFGRFQVLQNNPTLIADVAHNQHGITQLIKQINNIKNQYENVVFILGFVKDKDVDACIKLMPPWANYIITEANIPRAMPINDLSKLMAENKLAHYEEKNVNRSITFAKYFFGSKSLIVVCGSIFLVGEIKDITNA